MPTAHARNAREKAGMFALWALLAMLFVASVWPMEDKQMGNQEKFSGTIIGASIYAKNLGHGPWEYSIRWQGDMSEEWTGEFATWQDALEALREQLEALDERSR